MKRVVISANTSWNLFNFRRSIIQLLLDRGVEVVAVAPPDAFSQRLIQMGCRFIPLEMDNKGTNPLRELALLVRFALILASQKPDAYLSYTIKPNIYGSLAAHLMGIHAINNVAGLGAPFARRSLGSRFIRRLYRFALERSSTVFFQNDDDRGVLAGGRDMNSRWEVLPGSGVNLQHFEPQLLPTGPKVRFIMLARLLWDKGVAEFVEAGRILRSRWPTVEMHLGGFFEDGPGAVPRAQIEAWVAAGDVCFVGASDDVRREIRAADCVVLPSYYREGVPRILLEAAAMGRPVIAADVVGTREALEHGVTGLLCRARDANDLAAKMEAILAMGEEGRAEMGQRGRALVVRRFDERIVLRQYGAALERIGLS